MKKPSCSICKGCGLVKKTAIRCPKCFGRGCICCKNQSGLIQYPWEECDHCEGSGSEPPSAPELKNKKKVNG